MEPSEHRDTVSGCLAAFRSTRAAKNCFMLLIALAIIAQLAAFAGVYWGNVIDELYRPAKMTTQPAGAPNLTASQPDRDSSRAKLLTQPATAKMVESATLWKELLHWGLPTAKFIAFVACLLAVMTLMLAVKVAIIGRFGGVGDFTSAFFWSIVLLAIVTPWQQVLGGGFAAGAMYNLRELTDMTAQVKPSWGAANVGLLDQMLYFLRFAGFAGFALLVWLVVMVKFASGYKHSVLHPIGMVPEMRPTPQL